jgi:hypothetical protein
MPKNREKIKSMTLSEIKKVTTKIFNNSNQRIEYRKKGKLYDSRQFIVAIREEYFITCESIYSKRFSATLFESLIWAKAIPSKAGGTRSIQEYYKRNKNHIDNLLVDKIALQRAQLIYNNEGLALLERAKEEFKKNREERKRKTYITKRCAILLNKITNLDKYADCIKNKTDSEKFAVLCKEMIALIS